MADDDGGLSAELDELERLWWAGHDEAVGRAPCEICAAPTMPAFDNYRGHQLCSGCVITACGRCWRARMEMRFGRAPWRWTHYRYVCPACGEKGGWIR